MSEAMWAPWRMEYILDKKPEGCVFCTAFEDGPRKHEEHLILAARKSAFVIMNRFPYTHAHIMVVPSRHISTLGEMTSNERCEFFDLLADAEVALREALKPQGINIGMNLGKVAGAGIADHLHAHILPRWEGDTNFMPMVAGLRVMHQHLAETYVTLFAGIRATKSKMTELSTKRPMRTKLILVTLLGIVVTFFGLFFIMANDAWTVVHIPSAPWNPEPSWAAFESPLAAIMTVCFILGGVFTFLVSRVISRDKRRRAREDKQRIDALQKEISSVNRLMESSGSGAKSIQREQL